MAESPRPRSVWAFSMVVFASGLLLACGEDPTSNGSVRPVPDTPFETVSDVEWDDTAVRQVLHVFALGGFAGDAQIQSWADMSPEAAIVEMLTFDEFNPQLSPENRTGGVGTLAGLSRHWSSDAGNNMVPPDARADFALDSWNAPARIWLLAMSRTGPNPVRQRIGLLETNYHMVANQDVGVNNWQVVRYFDDLMNGLADDRPYQEIVGIAAKSAAVAVQYNHRENIFSDARFLGNEDFGREFHQLYFGILGDYDPEAHELVTIRNTAKMLTDMPVEQVEREGRLSDVVTFGTQHHYPGDLEILGETVSGDTAAERIDAAVRIAVRHQESLDNLPLIFVRFLADDHLDETETAVIQAAWASLETKNLLDFLRAYAISTTFHSTTRVKQWSSIERNVLVSNLMTLNPLEAFRGIYSPRSQLSREGVSLFRPLRNVFGGQTGVDAMANGNVFREAYNQSVDRYWQYARVSQEEDGREVWVRNWDAVIPAMDGEYPVEHVAEWLWQRFIADGLDNFGPLERAHVYSLLGSGVDFGLFVDEDNPLTVYTAADLQAVDLQEVINDMSVARMNLGASDRDDRMTANTRVGMAVNFIIATPYAFIQEGR